MYNATFLSYETQKVSHTMMLVRMNKIRLHPSMETLATCTICGLEDESSFHAMLKCPHARALLDAMGEEWRLPAADLLFENNPDWFLHMIRRVDVDQRVTCMMTFWRIWHVHNEITHQKKPSPIEASKRFLTSYIQSLMLIKQNLVRDVNKGKHVLDMSRGFGKKKKETTVNLHDKHSWKPPEASRLKLNVDGGFSADGRAGTGMILRDHKGEVVFAACRCLDMCADALDSELAAMEEGLTLALAWEPGDLVLESDCADAIRLVAKGVLNLSRYSMRVQVIHEKIREGEITIKKVCREANGASHGLAMLGKVQRSTGVWRQSFPPEIAEVIRAECTQPVQR